MHTCKTFFKDKTHVRCMCVYSTREKNAKWNRKFTKCVIWIWMEVDDYNIQNLLILVNCAHK